MPSTRLSAPTLTTVGYGDIYPVTPEGRLAAGALMVLGITLFAAITGTMTSYIMARRAAPAIEATNAGDVIDLIRRLGELRAQALLSAEEFEAKKADLLARL